MTKPRKISLRYWKRPPVNSRDFYYPMLAYECCVCEITEEGDAIQEAALKLISRMDGYSAASIGNVLGGLPPEIVKVALERLESKGLIEHPRGENWKLCRPLDEALKILFEPSANRQQDVGFMFYNPVLKNIFPYFYKGNLALKTDLSNDVTELSIGKETFNLPQELEDGVNSEWDKQYELAFQLQKSVGQKVRSLEKNESEDDEELVGEIGGFEDEETIENTENSDLGDFTVFSNINEALVRPFKKAPIPVLVKMRVVFEENAENGNGYWLQSPFPLEDIDDFEQNVRYLRANSEISKTFCFWDEEKRMRCEFLSYLEDQVSHKFPKILERKKDAAQKMAERWPRVAALRDKGPVCNDKYREFLYIFERILEIENNPPTDWREAHPHQLNVLIDQGLEFWMEEVMDGVVAELKKEKEYRIRQKINEIKLEAESIEKNVLHAKGLMRYFHLPENSIEPGFIAKALSNFTRSKSGIFHTGNSSVHKLVNMMWLEYKYGMHTPRSKHLLRPEGFADFVGILQPLQKKRNKGGHANKGRIFMEKIAQQERRLRYEYLVAHIYDGVVRLLDTLEVK